MAVGIMTLLNIQNDAPIHTFQINKNLLKYVHAANLEIIKEYHQLA
jgi:hypothetical protein